MTVASNAPRVCSYGIETMLPVWDCGGVRCGGGRWIRRRHYPQLTVEVHFLTVRHHNLLQLGRVGSVFEAKADSGDDVPGLQRVLVPAVCRTVFLVRAADLPLFDGSVGLDVELDHHVRIGPPVRG